MNLKLKLHWQILIALVLAVFAGILTGEEAGIGNLTFYGLYDFIGTLFLNALMMIIVPLIMSSIISGMANMADGQALGKLGLKTLSYYLVSSLIAILIGLAFVNLMSPGIGEQGPLREQLGLSVGTDEALERVEGRGSGDMAEIFIRMIPKNIIQAAAEGQMLGLIFFSLLFGFFMTRIPGHLSQHLKTLAEAVFETMMKLTMAIMSFAPIGVFALVAKTVASTGFSAFQPLIMFFITATLALATHAFVAMPLLLKFVGKVDPKLHFKAMSPALLTAFSTASSSATLPLTMECLEKNAKVSNRTSSFVLPLGATVNMDGTALYECVAAMFIAQAYGLELGFTTQFTIVIIALLTSIGVAGIPAASLVAIAIILAAIGLPAEGIGLILVVDRLLDMMRTAVNVFSDSCGAVIIAKSEGEDQVLSS
ncbi:MAG: dicarboxylate/amino acid:cation symporter [Oligoflexus sp.]